MAWRARPPQRTRQGAEVAELEAVGTVSAAQEGHAARPCAPACAQPRSAGLAGICARPPRRAAKATGRTGWSQDGARERARAQRARHGGFPPMCAARPDSAAAGAEGGHPPEPQRLAALLAMLQPVPSTAGLHSAQVRRQSSKKLALCWCVCRCAWALAAGRGGVTRPAALPCANPAAAICVRPLTEWASSPSGLLSAVCPAFSTAAPAPVLRRGLPDQTTQRSGAVDGLSSLTSGL